MRRKWFSFSLTFLICFVYLFPQVAFAEGIPSFSLKLANSEVKLGNEIQVTVTGMNLTDVYGYELNLDFDHTMLEFKGIKGGISGGFSINPQVDGNHLLFASTKTGQVAGESGTLNLATVTFETIRQGDPAIELKNMKLVDSKLKAHTYSANAKVTASTVIVTLTPNVTYDSITKTATAIVNEADWNKAVQQAVSNKKGIKNLQIIIKEMSSATAYALQLPRTAYSTTGTPVQFHVVSPLASVLLSNKMFDAGKLPAGEVVLKIGRADVSKLEKGILNQIGDRPVIDISLQSGGKQISWNNPDAPVTITIPYSPNAEELKNPEHIVVWYLSSDGQVTAVPSGRYDAKTGTVAVIFTTTHFSKYAISFVQKTFDDLKSVGWAKKQIEVLASKGIINGVSDKRFYPAKPVTRADFIVLLVKTLELDGSKGMGNPFSDVQESDYYSNAVRIARGMGITEGAGNNLFKPRSPITREEMIVMTERTLRLAKQITTEAEGEQLKQFNDYAKVSDYAVQGVAAMVKMGLIQGYDKAIHPKDTTTRAEAAVLMYNIYTLLYK